MIGHIVYINILTAGKTAKDFQMKKDNFLILGMLAMVLALGLVFAGCNTVGSNELYDGPKTVQITGYNSSQGIIVGVMNLAESADSWPPAANAQPIDGQTITYPVLNWEKNSEGVREPWKGTGKFFIWIQCSPPKNDSSKDGSIYVYSVNGTNPAPVDIRDAVTTLEWSKFIWSKDYKSAG
jgi:hypothetical protein